MKKTNKQTGMDLFYTMMLNFPLVVLNVIANLLFIFCLVHPIQGEPLKQPLKLLIWTIICSTLSFQVSLLLLLSFLQFFNTFELTLTVYGMFILSLSTSMTASVWLNVFYYLQIVPSKTAVFLWVKRNLKPVIYCVWVVEKLLISLTVICIVVYHISFRNLVLDIQFLNITIAANLLLIKVPSSVSTLATATMVINEIYFITCLCIMSVSSWSTAIYLSRHVRQMSSKGLSCSHIQSQVRVTITGILQEALFVFLSVWTLLQYILCDINEGPLPHLSLANTTIINLYMIGTSGNLGMGQTVFRHRALDLWHRAARCCTTRRDRRPQPRRMTDTNAAR